MTNNYLSDGGLYFSSSVPEVYLDFEDSYSYDSFLISLETLGEVIFKASYRTSERNACRAIDIADIIHTHIKCHNLAYADVKICWYDPDQVLIGTRNASVIFSSARFLEPADSVLRQSFLSDFDSLDVPESYSGTLTFFEPVPVPETGSCFFEIYSDSGSFSIPADLTVRQGFNTIVIDVRDIMRQAVDSFQASSEFIPTMIRVRAGDRTFDFFISRIIPAALIYCRNSFNLECVVPVFGSWQIKDEKKAETAYVGGMPAGYDLTADSSVEITSEPMDAESLSQYLFLGTSPQVRTVLLSGRTAYVHDAVITSSNASICSSGDEMQQLKLTLSISGSYGVIRLTRSGFRIFNDIFNKSFS